MGSSGRYKKIMGTLLTVVLLFVVIGCSSGGGTVPSGASGEGEQPQANAGDQGGNDAQAGDAQKVTVEFWNFLSGSDGETMVNIVEEFNNTHPNIEVKAVTQDFAQYYTKLKTATMAGTKIDLALSHDISVWDLIRTGVIVPIEDEAARVGMDIDFSSYIETVERLKYEGKRYAVPLDGVILILYYNKDILEEAGLLNEDGSPKIGEGLDGLLEAFRTVQQNVPNMAPLVVSTGPTTSVYLLNTLYYSNGGPDKPLVSNDGTTFDIDDGTMLTALKLMKQLHEYALPGVDNATEAFTNQKAAFMIEGTWQMNAISKGLQDKMGVIKIPQLGTEYRVPVYSHTFVLPKNDNRDDATTEAALEFVKYFGGHNYIWASSGHMPGNKTALETEEFKALPNHKYYMDQVNFPSPIEFGTPFNIKGAPELIEPMAKMVKGQIDEQQALDEMKKRMAESLNQ